MNRKVAARGVQHQLRNGERRDAIRPFEQQPLHLRLDLVQPADARAQDHAATKGLFLRKIQTRVSDRVNASHQRELREAIDALGFFLVDIIAGIPIIHVAAKFDFEIRRVELANRMHPALAAAQTLEQIFDLQTQRRDDP